MDLKGSGYSLGLNSSIVLRVQSTEPERRSGISILSFSCLILPMY